MCVVVTYGVFRCSHYPIRVLLHAYSVVRRCPLLYTSVATYGVWKGDIPVPWFPEYHLWWSAQDHTYMDLDLDPSTTSRPRPPFGLRLAPTFQNGK